MSNPHRALFGEHCVSAPEPQIVSRGEMARVVEALRAAGYTSARCAAHLGVSPKLSVHGGVAYYRPALDRQWTPDPHDSAQILAALFLGGRRMPLKLVQRVLHPGTLASLERMRLIDVLNPEEISSALCFFPCGDNYIATDQLSPNPRINQVMFLWGESYILGGIVHRTAVDRTVDLCTGSGIHALLAAKHSRQVVAVDVNARAIAFAKFNAALWGLSNIDFRIGDLYEPLDGKFDLLLANPPYNPDAGSPAGANFWSGGASGFAITERIVEGLDNHLQYDARCHVVALFPLPPDVRLRDKCVAWLSASGSRFDVAAHTVPAPGYVNPFVVTVPELPTGNFRFGLLSLRKGRPARASENGVVTYSATDCSDVQFFGPDGACLQQISGMGLEQKEPVDAEQRAVSGATETVARRAANQEPDYR
jgi:hypothetical protein